jgi:hypothetical protein
MNISIEHLLGRALLNYVGENKITLSIPGDSDWYSRPYIFFILRKKYSKPYTRCPQKRRRVHNSVIYRNILIICTPH